MAQPTCSPFATESLIVNTSEGESHAIHLDATVDRLKAEVSKGINNKDARNVDRLRMQIETMTGMTLSQIDDYVQARIKRVRKGEVLGGTTPRIAEEQVVAAATIIWEKSAQGLKQLAANFKMKRGEGQQALEAGRLFLNNMKGFNDLGRQIASNKFNTGSQLRQYKLAKESGFINRVEVDMAQEVSMEFIEDTSRLAENSKAFEAIADMLESGNLEEALALTEKIAKQIDMMDDPRMIAGTVSRWKSTWNTWDEVWINGLLSAPGTFVTNAVGAAWVVMRPLMQSGFAKAFAASGIGGPEFTKAANLAAAEAGAQLTAMQVAFSDAAMLGWQAAKTETSLLGGPTTQNITAANFRKNPLFARIPAGEEIDRAINVFGGLVRLPSRGMLGMDEFAKTIALRGEVAAAGVFRAVRHGNVDPADLRGLQKYVDAEMRMAFDVDAGSLANRYRFNPNGATVEDVKAASYLMAQAGEEGLGRNVMNRAKETVFQEDNAAAKFINKTIDKTGPVRFIIKPFIPFVQTPTNILKQGLWESTGLGAAGNVFNIVKKEESLFKPMKTFNAIQKELLRDPGNSARIAGQISFMTVVGGMTYGMAMNGMLTGGGPEQWATGRNARAAQRAWEQNNVPYSIGIPGTEGRIPLDKLGEPFATGLRMIADLGMYSGFMDRTGQDHHFGQIIGILSAGVFEASFLRGLDDLMTIIRSGFEGNVDYELGRGVQNFVASQMPFGSLLAAADRMQNPYRAAYEGTTFSEMIKVHEVALGEGILGKLVNKIPGVETSPMLTDQLTGEHVPIIPGTGPYGFNALQQAIPFFPRGTKADETWELVFAIKGQYSEKSLGVGLEPTSVEQQQFNKIMADEKINGKTLREELRAFGQRPDVKEFIAKKGIVLKGTGIEKELDRIINRYRNRARDLMIRSNPNLAQRAVLEKAIKSAKQGNNVEAANSLQEQMDELVRRARKGY